MRFSMDPLGLWAWMTGKEKGIKIWDNIRDENLDAQVVFVWDSFNCELIILE